MNSGDNAPATKDDIRMLMEQMGEYYDRSERHMAEWKDEIKEHFDLVAENMKYDFVGAFADKIQQHEDRLVRLEQQNGLRAG